MRNILLIIGFLLLSSTVFSQKDYYEGYVITNNKDTVFGLIKDRKSGSSSKLYKKIYLKKKRFGKKKFPPSQIVEYKKGDDIFESHWIYETMWLFKITYTSRPYQGKKEFFKVVKRGYLSYYKREYQDYDSGYIDAAGFFKRKDEDYFVRVTQGIFGLKKKSLAKYFCDCPDLAEKILSKEIKTPLEIVAFYNKCNIIR